MQSGLGVIVSKGAGLAHTLKLQLNEVHVYRACRDVQNQSLSFASKSGENRKTLLRLNNLTMFVLSKGLVISIRVILITFF